MGAITFTDIYDQGIDIDELAQYYKKKKAEEQEKKNKERQKKLDAARDAAATAIKAYFNVLSPDNNITIGELKDNLIDLERPYKNILREYKAVKTGDKDWDVKFKGDFTEEEKKDILNRIKKYR